MHVASQFRILCATLIAAAAADGLAQSGYPTKPVRVVVPSSAGGGTDIVARIIMPELDKWAKVARGAGLEPR